jgi:hypothetical protein
MHEKAESLDEFLRKLTRGLERGSVFLGETGSWILDEMMKEPYFLERAIQLYSRIPGECQLEVRNHLRAIAECGFKWRPPRIGGIAEEVPPERLKAVYDSLTA